jgi:hypothetical protein
MILPPEKLYQIYIEEMVHAKKLMLLRPHTRFCYKRESKRPACLKIHIQI